MRIIAGEFRSRRLKAPPGDLVRPTSDRTREAVFNILAARAELQGARVADVFAGSGALGLEALSRGAAHLTIVERNPGVLRVSRENAKALDVVDRCTFLAEDALTFLRRMTSSGFDLIFADPPYQSKDVADVPSAALRALKPGGFLILEHDRRHDFKEDQCFLMERTYGGTMVTFFQSDNST